MDECGKFILISKAFHSSSSDPVTVSGFANHDAKYGEVLDYCIQTARSNTAKGMSEISKIFDPSLSDISKLSYQAIEDGTIEAEARTISTHPLEYRNSGFYINFVNGTWASPRYPSDKVCAAQIKLVKGASRYYLIRMNTDNAIPRV